MNPKASPLTYLGILVVFIMPFLEFSCQGQKIASLNGYQVAFGTELATKSSFTGEVQKQKVNATPMVAIVLVLTLIAAGVALINGKAGAVPAGLAALLLLLARSGIEKNTMEQGEGLIAVNFQSGYYLSLLIIVAGAVLGIVTTKKKESVAEDKRPIPPELPSATRDQAADAARSSIVVADTSKPKLTDEEITSGIAQVSMKSLGIKHDQLDSPFTDLRVPPGDIHNLLETIEERFGVFIPPVERGGIFSASDIMQYALRSNK